MSGERTPLSEPLLRPADVARLLNVKVSWVHEAVRTGRLPYLKLGRHTRFLRSDIERHLLTLREPARR